MIELEEHSLAGLHEVLRMAFPVIVAVASATAMQFVDFWMVSQVGEAQTAAVTPAGMLVFMPISFLIGVLSCNSTFVSQSYAKGRLEDCARYTWQALYVSAIGGILSMGLWPLAPKLFAMIGHEAELQKYEGVYFQIRLLSVATAAAGAGLGGFFQGVGRPMIIMWVSLVANVVNIGLNYVLIFGKLGVPAMGVAGAAWGTVFALFAQVALLMGVFLTGHYAKEYGSRHTSAWDGKRMKGLFRIGWAAGVQFVLDMSCWGVFTALVVGRLGKTELAASNIALQIMHLSFMPTVGLGIATTALVGQKIGKGNLREARSRAETAIKLGMGYMFIMGVLFWFFREPLIGLFRPEADVIRLGSQVLMRAAAFQLIDGLGIVCSGALKGAGDTRFPALMQISYAWLVFLPAAYFLTYKMDKGVVGAWLAATFFVIVLGITLVLRWKSGAWERIDIFREGPVPAAEMPGAMVLYEPREEMLEIGPVSPAQKAPDETDPNKS